MLNILVVQVYAKSVLILSALYVVRLNSLPILEHHCSHNSLD